MCGIVGIYDLNLKRNFSKAIIKPMLDTLIHRGPDAEGFFEFPGYSCGARRLILRDKYGGNQPMVDSDFVLSLNGELFSYKEEYERFENLGINIKTKSDTELFLKGLKDEGEEFLKRIDAQFALGFYNQTEHSLMLARDEFGILPLFYTIVDGLLIYASEVKAILASGLVLFKLNPLAVDSFITGLAARPKESCFEGIHSLEPGHVLRGKGGRVKIEKLFKKNFNKIEIGTQKFRKEQIYEKINQLEEIFISSIIKRIDLDSKIALYLSGGVDSSLIAALTKKLWKKDYPLTAYSIKLRNNYNQKDESNLASQTAKLLKIEHRVLNVSDQDIINNYVKAIYFSEIPILDHSNVSLMLLAEKVKEDGFQSVLTGEGADEAFGGYPWDYYFNFPGGKHLANLLSLFSNNFNRELNKEYKNYSQNILFSPLSSIRNLFYSKEYLEELKNKKKNYYPVTIDSNWSKVDKFQKSLQLDYEWLLAGHLLLDKGDRMAMSASIESRYPFLDPRLVKYTDSLYKDWKIKNFKNKWILRSLAEKYLPKETAWRKKHLFRVEPVIHGKSYPKWVEELLSPESIKITNLFDYKKVERLFKERLNPKTFSFNNSFIQVGLSGVISTQLLYHLFSDKSLCHLKKSVRGSIPE